MSNVPYYSSSVIGMFSGAPGGQQYSQNLDTQHGGVSGFSQQPLPMNQSSFSNPTNLGSGIGQSAQYINKSRWEEPIMQRVEQIPEPMRNIQVFPDLNAVIRSPGMHPDSFGDFIHPPKRGKKNINWW